MATPDQARILAEHVQRLQPLIAKHKAGKKLTPEELEVLGAQKEVPVFDSMKAAEAALGVPRHVLQRAKASGQCPDAFRGSRVYATENLQLWLDAADTQPNDQDKSYWDSAISKQKLADMVWESDRKKGEYISKQLLAADLMQLASEQKALLRQKLENEYPGLVPAINPEQRAELKKLGRALADDICKRMQRLVDKWK